MSESCASCGAPRGEASDVCPACGAPAEEAPLDLAVDPASARRGGTTANAPPPTGKGGGTSAGSFAEQDRPNRLLAWRIARAPLLLLVGWFTAAHVLLDDQWVFIDNVNLVFHEAGHVLFGWAGDTIAALGGTLGQLMWPGGLALYFWLKRGDRFGAFVCVWWLGENFMGVGRYMADAAFEELALVGGNIHDWNYLFRRWDLLSSGQEIGGAVRGIGTFVMAVSLALLCVWTAAPREQDLERDARLD